MRPPFQAVTHPDDLHVGLDLFRDLVAGRRDHMRGRRSATFTDAT
ncbi:MAG: hypothetical protein R3C44_00010 [Chloroflexota bacterium]